jgi:hypothetical protein
MHSGGRFAVTSMSTVQQLTAAGLAGLSIWFMLVLMLPL